LLLFDREGELIQRVDAGAQALQAVGFSPAGDLLVTGGIDEVQEGHGKLTWWTVNGESRVEKRDEIDVDSEVSALAFDREGMTVATAQLRGSVETYAVDDGEMLTRFSPQSGPVSDVEFSIDGKTLATAGEDGTVRLFSAETGTESLILEGHDYLVTELEFTEDGRKLVSAAADGTVRVWALDLDDLLDIARENRTRELRDEECRLYLHLDECPSD
jgi:WD40 repeat protein